MAVEPPTGPALRRTAETLGMHLDDHDVDEFLALIQDALVAYDIVDAMPDNLPPVKYPRGPGARPSAADNPLNAWYVKATIAGAPGGALAGKTVAVKDNVCVAGVPMMVGAATLEGYVPDVDATIVTRILDAGGTILGKAHCECFCVSGSSNTNAAGPTQNPWRHGYSAGGSSSGSAALLAAGEVDLAIGGDQGGSIRIPASLCGVVGLKPTYGLVPYTGVMPIELTLDHVGPMSVSVADNARLLEAIAGEDGLDPRQYAPRTAPYCEALGQDIADLRIGVLREGFEAVGCAADVMEKVRNAAQILAGLGAAVEDATLPMHAIGKAIWTPIGLEGLTQLMMLGNGYGTNHRGLYVTSLMQAHAAWRERADDLSETLKAAMLAGQYMHERYRGHYYAKAQNQARLLRAAYDEQLARYDLLLLPSTPTKATPLPPADAPRKDIIDHAFGFNINCIPTNLTGHPALSIPCGLADGLPVGLMLIGRHYDEATLYRAAHAFEQANDWKTL